MILHGRMIHWGGHGRMVAIDKTHGLIGSLGAIGAIHGAVSRMHHLQWRQHQ